MSHLRLVPPAKSSFPFEIEQLAFAKIGDDIFICFKGEWRLAKDSQGATDVLWDWVRKITESLGPDDDESLPWPVPKGAT